MLIGELSERTGVSQRLLRYYEEQGLLSPDRAPNGYRHYHEDAPTTVRQIRALLDAGMSTQVIKDALPCVHGERPDLDLCPPLREILHRELAELDDRIDTLRRKRGALATHLADA